VTSGVLPIGRGRLDVGLPSHLAVHKSGGRDRWSPALDRVPEDPGATLWALLGEVLDPEIPVSLPELGLVYGAEMDGRTARVRLTFTATACPCMEFIREDVTDRLERESWIDEVVIEEVWDPPWTSARVTPEGRAKLKALGVGV